MELKCQGGKVHNLAEELNTTTKKHKYLRQTIIDLKKANFLAHPNSDKSRCTTFQQCGKVKSNGGKALCIGGRGLWVTNV